MNNAQIGTGLFLSFIIFMFLTVAIASLDILWLTMIMGAMTTIGAITFGWFICTHDAFVSGDEQ